MENYCTNLKEFYNECGFTTTPYTREKVREVAKNLGDFPYFLKMYLVTVGKVEEEIQFEKSFIDLDEWRVEDDMLIFAEYGPSCATVDYAVKNRTQKKMILKSMSELLTALQRDGKNGMKC